MKYIEPEMEVVEQDQHEIVTLTSIEEGVDFPTFDGSAM